MGKDYITEMSPGFHSGSIPAGEEHRVELLKDYGHSFIGGSLELITALAELTVNLNQGPDIILDDDIGGFFIGLYAPAVGIFELDDIRIRNTGAINATYRLFFY